MQFNLFLQQKLERPKRKKKKNENGGEETYKQTKTRQ